MSLAAAEMTGMLLVSLITSEAVVLVPSSLRARVPKPGEAVVGTVKVTTLSLFN